MIKRNEGSKAIFFVALHILLAIYSLGGICSKLAGQQEFLSFWFVVYYALVLLNLGVYAIVWQQIIKRIPLTTAYANKAIVIIWGILWGFLIFEEQIKWNMIVGAAVVIVGIVLVVTADE